MTIDRVRVEQVGGAVGRAYTNFYFSSVTTAQLTALGAFFTAIKNYFGTASTYTIPASGDTISELTGNLAGGWSATAPAPIVGTGSSIPSVLSGLLVTWKGPTVINGGRPVGKTIIVPASNFAYSTAGMIQPTTVTGIDAAATTFLAGATNFVIWHRPVYDRTVKPPVLMRPGGFVTPTTGKTSGKPTVLRSRRD